MTEVRELEKKLSEANSDRSLMKQQVKTSDRLGKMLAEYAKHLPEVIKNYGLALRRGMRHAAVALSRMLSLWLEFADLQVQALFSVVVFLLQARNEHAGPHLLSFLAVNLHVPNESGCDKGGVPLR